MKRVAYILHDINFQGGAHVATANLARELSERGWQISILTDVEPTAATRQRFGQVEFKIIPYPKRGFWWLVRGLCIKSFNRHLYPDAAVDPTGAAFKFLSQFDTVCVTSEADPLRRLVTHLPRSVRKVQLIHNDYAAWAKSDTFARRATRHDRRLYRGMDAVALVGEFNARNFAARYPELTAKTTSFKNVIRLAKPQVTRKALLRDGKINLLTIARANESQKATGRLIRTASTVVRNFDNVTWTFLGSGYDLYKAKVEADGLSGRIRFTDNASPADALAEADVLVLLSHFEGLPMVIYESFTAGVPVFATDVGGIAEQIADGGSGWLTADEDDKILQSLIALLRDPGAIAVAQKKLAVYSYDNADVIARHSALLLPS